jgi:hypothetical protein
VARTPARFCTIGRSRAAICCEIRQRQHDSADAHLAAAAEIAEARQNASRVTLRHFRDRHLLDLLQVALHVLQARAFRRGEHDDDALAVFGRRVLGRQHAE